MKRDFWLNKVAILSVLFFFSGYVAAQFNSGSTGADGPLDLLNACGPSNVCLVQVPESGVLNYTTINIPGVPTHRTLRFIRNSRNTPVTVLAQGNVTIAGDLDVSAPLSPDFTGVSGGSNIPGPGGFYGGGVNMRGFGPGGGAAGGDGGAWVGPLSLFPIIGGSGGGGYTTTCCAIVGGGGGGAITVASSGTIFVTATGRISATYGCSFSGGNGSCGSGGAIRLVANTVNVAGQLFAPGRGFGSTAGVIRMEAPDGQRIFTGTSNPPATLAQINPSIISNTSPLLSIVSVGGFAVPSYAGTRFDTIDLLLPNQIPDPVSVVVSGNNIPTSAQVQVGFVSGSTSGTSAPCNLAGTFASSTCTATVSNLNRTAVTYLLATVAFTPSASLAQFNPKGPNQVAKIRLEAALGARSKYVFLDSVGKVLDTAKLSREFLGYFGM